LAGRLSGSADIALAASYESDMRAGSCLFATFLLFLGCSQITSDKPSQPEQAMQKETDFSQKMRCAQFLPKLEKDGERAAKVSNTTMIRPHAFYSRSRNSCLAITGFSTMIKKRVAVFVSVDDLLTGESLGFREIDESEIRNFDRHIDQLFKKYDAVR
jgi:hypothetical protein